VIPGTWEVGLVASLMDVEDFVDRLGTLGDDLVAHLGMTGASGAAVFL
jgi:hypothetical protein